MKYSNTIITLLVILFLALLIGILFGVKSQEGITYNKFTVLEEILTKNDKTNQQKIETIKTLNIEDKEFNEIINNSEYDDDRKISEINSLVTELFKTNLSENKYSDALLIDIPIPTTAKPTK
jgi:hypothetical protein